MESSHTHSPNEHGAVLILILAMVAVLSITAVSLVRLATRNTVSASYLMQKEQAELITQSVVACGLAVLSNDPPEVDTLLEAWNRFPIAMMSLQHQVEGMSLEARIVDASSRFNLNSLGSVANEQDRAAQIFLRMMRKLFPQLREEQRVALLWRIKDWIDGDTVEARWGRLEDEVYASLNNNALPLNRAFMSMNEVYEAVRDTSLSSIVTSPKFGFFFTTHMRTKININTATTIYLRSLFADDSLGKDFSDEIAKERLDDQANLSGEWFIKKSLPVATKTVLAAMGSSRSDVFFIDVIVTMPSMVMQKRFYVERSGKKAVVKHVGVFPHGELAGNGKWNGKEMELLKQNKKKGL